MLCGASAFYCFLVIMSQFITEQLEGNVMSSVTSCSSDGDAVL